MSSPSAGEVLAGTGPQPVTGARGVSRRAAGVFLGPAAAATAVLFSVGLGGCSGDGTGDGRPGTGLPGQTTVAATPAEGTGSAAPVSSAPPTTSAAPIQPVAVKGYEYGKASTGMADAMAIPAGEKVFTAVTVKGSGRRTPSSVTSCSTGCHRETTALQDFDQQILEMVRDSVAGKGTTVTESTIEGQRVSVVTKGESRNYIWYADEKLMMLMADKGLPVGKQFVTAYLRKTR
jgi:hypothetical protein